MSDGLFNGIAILDAIPEGELNTAVRLHESLRDIADYKVGGLQVRYFRLVSRGDLDSSIAALRQEANTSGLKPWLHLEGHGSSDQAGFATANGVHVTWSRLKDVITPLNVITNLNLVLVLAACYGGSFASAIRAEERAPVLGLIGPTRELPVGDIEVDFPAFYRTFFETESLAQAIEALTARVSEDLYYRTSAKQFFYDIWRSYKNNECSARRLRERARELTRRLESKNAQTIPSEAELVNQIRAAEKSSFEKFRDIYFMNDIYPSNRVRFHVTYDEAEACVSRE